MVHSGHVSGPAWGCQFGSERWKRYKYLCVESSTAHGLAKISMGMDQGAKGGKLKNLTNEHVDLADSDTGVICLDYKRLRRRE